MFPEWWMECIMPTKSFSLVKLRLIPCNCFCQSRIFFHKFTWSILHNPYLVHIRIRVTLSILPVYREDGWDPERWFRSFDSSSSRGESPAFSSGRERKRQTDAERDSLYKRKPNGRQSFPWMLCLLTPICKPSVWSFL